MIFVTVGAQMPFDRLVRAVDDWAGRRGRRDVFAQVGPTSFCPTNIPYARFLDPAAFASKVREASVIVAHAGMGSILTALEVGKPILIMPRRGDLKETRNDHQVATARRFQGRTAVAFDEVELAHRLDEIDSLSAASRISSRASELLGESLRGFVERGKLPCATLRGFDGVICFGADEPESLATMRQLSSRVPVLYMMPTDVRPGVILDCLRRALHALTGVEVASKIGPNLWTRHLHYSEIDSDRVHMQTATRVRVMARHVGMRNPLVWAAREVPAAIIDRIPHSALVCCGGLDARFPGALAPDLVVRHHTGSDAAAGADRVLRDLARKGIGVNGVLAHPSDDLLAPLSPANSDLLEWTSRPVESGPAELLT